jgi:hypothetical protein
MKRLALKIFKWMALTLIVVFTLSQFVRPTKTNPPVDESRTLEAHTVMTPEIASIFARSCNDCHTNKTTWPWYSNVAPVSWFVIDHVNDGRRHLNFSDWSRMNEREAGGQLEQICKEVKNGGMPINSYTWIHRHAFLSNQDVQTICAWTSAERERLLKH